MDITINDLREIISSSADLGVQHYIKYIKPENDRVNQSEAQRYIESLGYRQNTLRKWVDASLLTPVKLSTTRTGRVYYSMAEIKDLIFSLRTHDIVNR